MEQNKYQNGVIYTIKTDNGLYVGSTINFRKRKNSHKTKCFNETDKLYNIKLYQNIRENDGEYSIEIYKMFPCNSSEELIKEEEKVRKYLNSNLNMQKCFTTEEEVKERKRCYACKDEQKEQRKAYYYKNKDMILEQMNEKIICECGCFTTKGNISRHRKSNKHTKLINNIMS